MVSIFYKHELQLNFFLFLEPRITSFDSFKSKVFKNTNKLTSHSLQQLAWKDPNRSQSFHFNLALQLTTSPPAIYLSLHPSLICLPLSFGQIEWSGTGHAIKSWHRFNRTVIVWSYQGESVPSGTSMGQLRTDRHTLVAAFMPFSSDSFSHKKHSLLELLQPFNYEK